MMFKDPSLKHWLLILGFSLFCIGFVAGSEPTPPWSHSTLSDQDRQIIEALIFGTGPFGAGSCPAYQRWAGFPRGSHVEIVLATNVAEDNRHQIQTTLNQVTQATLGSISVSLHMTEEPEPSTQDFHIVSMTHNDPTRFGCLTKVGCTHHEWKMPGILKAGRAIQPESQTPQAYAHDVVGHGILGMCHILAKPIGGAGHSLMSGGPGVYSGQNSGKLTELDIQALQVVYASNLSPGATRQDFIQAGLINP